MRRFLLLAALLLLPSFATAQEHPVNNTKIASPHAVALLQMLRAGGLVIYFRHGRTPDYSEPSITDFSDCPRQRNLNPLGRAQSALIGDDFKALNIPVGRVIASPFCRCMDTARIAFGKVTLADEVRGMKADPKMRTHFTALQQPGANLIIVGHNSASGLIGEESCARPRRWWSSPWARTNTSWWPASGPSNGRNSARKPRTAARRAQP